MRAIVVREHGGPEVLVPAEVAEPVPGAGQLLVAVEAVGVNFVEAYNRSGHYPSKPPFTPGGEAAGTVVAVGERVAEFGVGDVVVSTNVRGAYAERALVDADRAVRVPEGLGARQAAAALLQGMTAHYLTHATYPVQPGDAVLVHAAAGGMGLLLTQLVKVLGGRVIGTVSTAEKERLAREAGADEVVGYDGFPAAVRAFTGGAGVSAVYDGVGRTTFDGSLESLRRRGTLVLYGAASGPVPPLDPARLQAAGSVFLTRPTLVDHVVTREELLARASDVLGWVAAGDLNVHIGRTYPLDSAGEAHSDLEGRRTTGKVLLIP
ncbi:MAG TPA: quinone oxidoreductase [Streptosporangiaceae bacterium]|jgi:NADPH2:quinone reductase